MSSADLSNFLDALKVVQQDHTCGVCSQLCKNAVTLSECFHIICSEHFDSLKACPKCGISLEGCRTYSDERLGSCIDSVQILGQMFDKHINQQKPENTGGRRKKREKQSSSKFSSTSAKEDKPPKLSNKRSKQKHLDLEHASKDEDSSQENKKPNVNPKSDSKTTNLMKTKSHVLDVSLKTTVSSKSNKGLEKRNLKGETVLHIACRLGQVDKITELLQEGANTNTKDNAGWTPLHEVVQNGRLDLVKLLLQFNTLINVPGQSNETPLHEAVRYGHKDIAEELVKNGADIDAKNSKGETPMQLATGEMESVLKSAAENIIQTQSVNITHISSLYVDLDFDDIRVYCVSEFRTVHNKLKALLKHHSNLHIEPKFTKKVTHLIVDAQDDGICQSSLDILQGIVTSLWILTTKWVTKSTVEKLEPFANHEVTGVNTKDYNGPKNARYNKYKQLPRIFDGCHFYLHNFHAKYEVSQSIVLTKAILSKLIMDAGGIILRRVPNPESIPDCENLVPYHARKDGKLVECSHYIIFKDMYEPMYNMQHLKALPIGWLIECFEKYELCEPW